MKELLESIEKDLKITKYSGESMDSYYSRIIYSALGLWCLTSAKKSIDNNNNNNNKGITKNAQTRLISSLLEKYETFFPQIAFYFHKKGPTKLENEFPIFIRTFYEETGYFLNQNNSLNFLNPGNELLSLSDEMFIIFGLSSSNNITMNGLGVNIFQNRNDNKIMNIKDFLIRDSLSPEEFIENNFDNSTFKSMNTISQDLEFFDPSSKKNIYKSWNKIANYKYDKTIARNYENREFYKVLLNKNGENLFSSNKLDDYKKDQMSGREYNRTYLALRKYYNNPPEASIKKLDEEYSELTLYTAIPNREYYYLLLNGWPKKNFDNKYNFIIRNYSVESCKNVLENIGFEINQ